MVTIRPATHADLSALHPVIERAYRGDASRAGWTHEADLVTGERTDIATLATLLDGDSRLLIALRDDTILGCVNIARHGGGMEDMRGDMSGAAAVMGATLAAAKRGARANVVAIAALAENMPGDNASRPGDVVRTMNGQTVEIISTDAEGRMVMADANQYAIDRFKPAALVNIATLTGAIVTALGDDYAGLFARDDALAARIERAADVSGEAVWRMPLHPSYAKDLESPVADIAASTRKSGAGAGRAAHFLSHVTPGPTPWAHIDMAGVDGTDESRPTMPKGARGFGVRLFDALIREYER